MKGSQYKKKADAEAALLLLNEAINKLKDGTISLRQAHDQLQSPPYNGSFSKPSI